MKTARVAPTTWTSNSSSSSSEKSSTIARSDAAAAATNTRMPEPCTDAAMDAYAQRILEQHAAVAAGSASRNTVDEALVDDSLGPYVTSLLRNVLTCSSSQTTTTTASDGVLDNVTLLPDYEGLIELLQEHCGLATSDQAQAALQEIASVVAAGRLPLDNEHPPLGKNTASRISSSSTSMVAAPPNNNIQRPNHCRPPHASTTAAAFPSLQVLQTTLPPPPTLNEEEFPTLSQANAPNVMSPHHADSLIPLHLLDEEADGTAAMPPGLDEPLPQDDSTSLPNVDFPPLSASVVPPRTSKKTTASRAAAAMSNKKSSSASTASHKQHDPDLAAALFRPARSRQCSMDDETTLVAQLGTTLLPTTAAPTNHIAAAAAAAADPFVEPQHYKAVVAMLLHMNGELLSADAARAAAMLAPGANVQVAQYLIQAALQAPPICRHLLAAGCYRSDCTYSHDLEGHTCIFWLRGRCGKNESCRFLHGFHPKLLAGLELLEPPGGPFTTTTTAAATLEPAGYDTDAPSFYHDTDTFGGGFSEYMLPAPVSAPWWTAAAAPSSFVNIASQGYDTSSSFASSTWNTARSAAVPDSSSTLTTLIQNIPTVKIPQDLWNPHENRDASVFHIADPMERYRQVSARSSSHYYTSSSTDTTTTGLIDLHFQSTKTFRIVLEQVLPEQLQLYHAVWIVTGTGHHVGTQTHQKGGGALEMAVLEWLVEMQQQQQQQQEGYYCGSSVYRGRDRNGQGGAILVKR